MTAYDRSRPLRRWLAGLVVYLVAIVVVSDQAATWINDIAWTVTSACAAWACLRTSRMVERPQRRAWLLLGSGCASWLIGQLHWNYYELVLERMRPGGLMLLDNMLQGGRIVAPETDSARVVDKLNRQIHADERVDMAMTVSADGLTFVRVR